MRCRIAGVLFILRRSVIHPLRGLLTWSLSKLDASSRSDEISIHRILYPCLIVNPTQERERKKKGRNFPETCDSGTIAGSFNEKNHIGDHEHSSSQYSSAFRFKNNSSENICSYDFIIVNDCSKEHQYSSKAKHQKENKTNFESHFKVLIYFS